MSETDEALKIWKSLKPMIDTEIESKTRSCVRAKKMTVTTVPDGSVIGVTEPYRDEIFVPYSSFLANAQIDDAVWVWYFFNNASTMIALSMGNGQLKARSQIEPGSVTVSLNNAQLTSYWQTRNGSVVSGPTTSTATLSFNVTGVPDGATVDSAVFSATFNAANISLLTVNGSPVGSGAQSVSLTPTETGNGVYTVEIKYRAYGNGSLSDGTHFLTLVVVSPTVTVNYSA